MAKIKKLPYVDLISEPTTYSSWTGIPMPGGRTPDGRSRENEDGGGCVEEIGSDRGGFAGGGRCLSNQESASCLATYSLALYSAPCKRAMQPQAGRNHQGNTEAGSG